MLPGARGSRWMPRKMAGSDSRMIDALSVAIRTPRVVLDSATHLYRGCSGVMASSVRLLVACCKLSICELLRTHPDRRCQGRPARWRYDDAFERHSRGGDGSEQGSRAGDRQGARRGGRDGV